MDAPYTVDNVRFALANSTVPGVPATSWEACLQEINELCGYKWYLKRQTNGATGGRVIFSKTFYATDVGLIHLSAQSDWPKRNRRNAAVQPRLKSWPLLRRQPFVPLSFNRIM